MHNPIPPAGAARPAPRPAVSTYPGNPIARLVLAVDALREWAQEDDR